MDPVDLETIRMALHTGQKSTRKDAAQAAFARLTDKAAADARALWAVRVLDAWSDGHPMRYHNASALVGGKFVCELREFDGYRQPARTATSRDAARLAAAEAVWPELPESVRAELGEQP